MLPKSNQQLYLKSEDVYAFTDFNTRLFCIQYGELIDTETTAKVYTWMKQGAESWFKEEDFRGGIFDFRNVKKFEIGNSLVAKQASQEVNSVADFSIFPLALVVNNVQQATNVRLSMQENDTRRKMLTFSENSALEFINNWNNEHNRQIEIPEDLLLDWPSFLTEED